MLNLLRDLYHPFRNAIPIDWDKVLCNGFAMRSQMFRCSFLTVLEELDRTSSRRRKYCSILSVS